MMQLHHTICGNHVFCGYIRTTCKANYSHLVKGLDTNITSVCQINIYFLHHISYLVGFIECNLLTSYSLIIVN